MGYSGDMKLKKMKDLNTNIYPSSGGSAILFEDTLVNNSCMMAQATYELLIMLVEINY
jgi:hypothetical protein